MDGREQTPHGRRSGDPDIAAMQETLSEIKETLGQVHDEAKKTNGRVTTLETARAVGEALATQRVLGRDWALRVLVGLVAAVAVIEPVALYFIASR